MKKRAVLIGLGVIAHNYFEGLRESPDLNLVAVCDINPNATARTLYGGLPFFADYRKAAEYNPEFAIICTAPESHYEIADHFLKSGINVIVEKPATTNSAQLQQLIALAHDQKLFFDCVFHWQYGSEILFLRDFAKKMGRVLSAASIVYDPYTTGQNMIKPERAGLCGAWFDSGINILSMLSHFVSIDKMTLKSKNVSFDKARNQPCFVNLSLLSLDVPLNIIINWNTDLTYKKSTIAFEKGIVDIYHSQQAVYLNGERIFVDATYPRLIAHYRNYFLSVLPKLLAGEVEQRIFSVHKPLFEIDSQFRGQKTKSNLKNI